MHVKAERNNNFEIVRVLCMIEIITYHMMLFRVDEKGNHIYQFVPSFDHIFASIFRLWGVAATGVFFMISAWHLQETDNRRLEKIALILFEVLFWSSLDEVIYYLFVDTQLSLETLIIGIVKSPVSNWFVIAYIGMYMYGPLLNEFKHCENDKLKKYIMVSFVFIVCIRGLKPSP